MKHTLKFTLLSLLFSISIVSFATDYNVVKDKTTVKWTGSHIVKGYDHYGYVQVNEGSFSVENGLITGGSITLDMNTISCTDIDDKKKNKKLVGHLKSDDFFGVQKHATATIVIKSSKKTDDNMLSVKEITFDTKLADASDKVKIYESEIKIDRTLFGVAYGSSLSDSFISDTMVLDIRLVGYTS
jgi:polyisoprenoid-binding protein YceI